MTVYAQADLLNSDCNCQPFLSNPRSSKKNPNVLDSAGQPTHRVRYVAQFIGGIDNGWRGTSGRNRQIRLHEMGCYVSSGPCCCWHITGVVERCRGMSVV